MVRSLFSSAVILFLLAVSSKADYTADFTLSQTASFQQRVQMSVFKAALAISNEATSMHPNVDSKRHILATAVLGNLTTGFTATLNMQFVFSTIETGLNSLSTDTQIDTAVSSVWNGIAGVSAADLAGF